MAEPTNSTTAGTDAPSDATTPLDLASVEKVTRARATTSGMPARTTRPKVPGPTAGEEAPPATAPAASATAPTESSARPANVQITQGGADRVEGDSVSISQGGASIVNARSVAVRQGGIANAQADDITVSMGGIALARADRVSVEMGGLGFAFAREANLTQGMARSVIAQDVRVDQGLVGTALAGRVTFERPSAIFLLIAGRTDGPVKALMDWRGALAFGAAFGLLAGLIRRR